MGFMIRQTVNSASPKRALKADRNISCLCYFLFAEELGELRNVPMVHITNNLYQGLSSNVQILEFIMK